MDERNNNEKGRKYWHPMAPYVFHKEGDKFISAFAFYFELIYPSICSYIIYIFICMRTAVPTLKNGHRLHTAALVY